MEARKWWGWGAEGVAYGLEDRPGFWSFLEKSFDRSIAAKAKPVALEAVELPDSRLTGEDLERLRALLGQEFVSVERRDRVHHSAGKSYRDLVRLRQGKPGCAPDAVVYPGSEGQVLELLRLAGELGVAVVPFGGGSSVVGGVEPLAGTKRAVLTCDLTRMNRILHVDRESLTADVEPGIYGPELEKQLGEMGLTLGHFPQSFEFSTLGGWAATRSAGQTSTRYGKIEDMIQTLRMATPSGIVETRGVPASAAGPDLKHLWIGSEGLFGILTQIRIRLHPVAELRDFRAFLFPQWENGVVAVRSLMQQEAPPAILRLSDQEETRTFLALSRVPHSTVEELKRRVGLWYLEKRGTPLHRGCLMLVGYEGPKGVVKAQAERGHELLRRAGGFDLGNGPVASWERERFTLPYLRDRLMDHRILIETLETCTTYSNLLNLYHAIGSSIRAALTADGLKGLVFCHVSHAYPDGASLYFTFIAPQKEGDELGQWQRIKQAATDTILREGGTITHHHGVGADHRPWMKAEHGERNLESLRAIKHAYDPQGLLNPGKLFTE